MFSSRDSRGNLRSKPGSINVYLDNPIAEEGDMTRTAFDMTKDNFEETLENNEIVLIDFWADWCGPCKAFKPIFEKVAAKHEDVAFAKVDTEDQKELAGRFGIQSIPTLGIFREKILLFLQPGMLPEESLDDVIKQVQGLDMEEVRKEFEARKAEAEAAHADGGKCGPGCSHDH